jgi:hypothetical protein
MRGIVAVAVSTALAFVRLFPVWFEFRGNNGTMLTENKAIAEAAHLRGNLELANLAERNLQWVVGRNPFS